MKSAIQVAAPPEKPLLVYDGDCGFCKLWIHRWQCVTGERIDYLPSQDPQIAERFPEIPRAVFDSSVQLIEPDGSVHSGAEAIFQSLAHNRDFHWLLDIYQVFPLFAHFTEWAYRLVARHRTFFSWVTKMFWGRHVERPSYVLMRRAFLSCLGIIYLVAFVSLWVQIGGLIGSNGIVPVRQTMEVVKKEADDARIGWGRYFRVPTLCWLNSSDSFLNLQCAAGTVLAVLLIAGIAPAPCLFLLWLIYLSLCTVSDPFLGFQWDVLLLETGLLAIFLAPPQGLPRRPAREAPPSRIAIWLLRWLLFKLMFRSGCVKLTSGDPTWRDLTALNYHFETQPLPTWIGWYAHQLPALVHHSDTIVMFVIEIGIPFLIFLPRRPRQLACLAFLALQFFILLTGNYCFFNLLTMVLCLTLLDDAALQKCLPARWCSSPGADAVGKLPSLEMVRRSLMVPLVVAVLITSAVQFAGMFHRHVWVPGKAHRVNTWLAPLRSFNGYGLFQVMTTSRPEIIVEGSNDGVNWQAYEFKYKAGDLKRRPAFVEPHQPRLDWQMWFAALGDYRQNPWFLNFCVRLLQGSPQVLALLEENPFPNAPPKYIRAVLYDYHFTDRATRRKTGEWWTRTPEGNYLPPVSLSTGPGGQSGVPAFP
ncbi:MAG TPA: lipase maturation factor family protein [Verrucomicrobiae bacterium]|nr:lipase maturation factor family protein [Verrucomicrobiae bacterium]